MMAQEEGQAELGPAGNITSTATTPGATQSPALIANAALDNAKDAVSAERQEEERLPRIVIYQQTYHRPASRPNTPGGSVAPQEYIPMLPLIEETPCAGNVTHVILAAIHVNAVPGNITLNDHEPFDERYEILWEEVLVLKTAGIKVMGMLGGAAKGTYARLDSPLRPLFEAYYKPLKAVIEAIGLDGLDLDVEEHMSLAGMVRLILRLRRDFGPNFIITLAPVAAALMGFNPDRNLSGFSYADLEKAVGHEIAWYNAQFYNGWGSVETADDFRRILAQGWDPRKIVLGCITNPEAGGGWVPDDMLEKTLTKIVEESPSSSFGGVMGWEYALSITVKEPYGYPWSWANLVSSILRP